MALPLKDIEVNGKIFHYAGGLTVKEAREEIRDCFSLRGGGIISTETGAFMPANAVIGTLTGPLSFVEGERAGMDRNKSPIV